MLTSNLPISVQTICPQNFQSTIATNSSAVYKALTISEVRANIIYFLVEDNSQVTNSLINQLKILAQVNTNFRQEVLGIVYINLTHIAKNNIFSLHMQQACQDLLNDNPSKQIFLDILNQERNRQNEIQSFFNKKYPQESCKNTTNIIDNYAYAHFLQHHFPTEVNPVKHQQCYQDLVNLCATSWGQKIIIDYLKPYIKTNKNLNNIYILNYLDGICKKNFYAGQFAYKHAQKIINHHNYFYNNLNFYYISSQSAYDFCNNIVEIDIPFTNTSIFKAILNRCKTADDFNFVFNNRQIFNSLEINQLEYILIFYCATSLEQKNAIKNIFNRVENSSLTIQNTLLQIAKIKYPSSAEFINNHQHRFSQMDINKIDCIISKYNNASSNIEQNNIIAILKQNNIINFYWHDFSQLFNSMLTVKSPNNENTLFILDPNYISLFSSDNINNNFNNNLHGILDFLSKTPNSDSKSFLDSLARIKSYDKIRFNLGFSGLTSQNNTDLLIRTRTAINNETFITDITLQKLIELNMGSDKELFIPTQELNLANNDFDLVELLRQCNVINLCSETIDMNDIKKLITILTTNNINLPPLTAKRGLENQGRKFYSFYKKMSETQGEISIEDAENAFNNQSFSLDLQALIESGELIQRTTEPYITQLLPSDSLKLKIDTTHIENLVISNLNISNIADLTLLLDNISASIANQNSSLKSIDFNINLRHVTYNQLTKFLRVAGTKIERIKTGIFHHEKIFAAIYDFLANVKPPLQSIEHRTSTDTRGTAYIRGFHISLHEFYPQVVEKSYTFEGDDINEAQIYVQDILSNKKRFMNGYQHIYATNIDFNALSLEDTIKLIDDYYPELQSIYVDNLEDSGLLNILLALNSLPITNIPTLYINDFAIENDTSAYANQKRAEIDRHQNIYKQFKANKTKNPQIIDQYIHALFAN